MSYYTQYHDHNFYFSNFAPSGSTDGNGYHEHEVLDRSRLVPRDHPHYDEIMALVEETYRPEDLPSNGSTQGKINGKSIRTADTRDLAEQAANPPEMWARMVLSYQQYIRKTARWIHGFNPDTKAAVKFQKKVLDTKSRMRREPSYRRKLQRRWELLKMVNPNLAR